MKKAEAEKMIRSLCHEWRNKNGNEQTAPENLSSSAFCSWLRNNYPECLNFRSPVAGVPYDVELWFDQEFKQAWKR